MGAVYFYHLTRQSVDHALAELLPKCLQNNWRVLVRGRDKAALERLDQALWLNPDDGFLPHGLAGGPHDEQQPILLAGEDTKAQHNCLMTVGGAGVSAEDVTQADRTCILFEAADEAQMSAARHHWAQLTEAGCSAKYWSQETGKWALKVEKN